jgi:hypothetical protein
MPSAELFSELAVALRERLAVISDRELREKNPEAQLERLKSVSEKIAALQAQLPQSTDPHLAHYLKNCSYDKALAFLENR